MAGGAEQVYRDQEHQEGELNESRTWSTSAHTLQDIDQAYTELEAAQRAGDFERASKIQYGTIPSLEDKAFTFQKEAREDASGEESMAVRDRVTSEDIAIV